MWVQLEGCSTTAGKTTANACRCRKSKSKKKERKKNADEAKHEDEAKRQMCEKEETKDQRANRSQVSPVALGMHGRGHRLVGT
jgi:hypothetical protein